MEKQRTMSMQRWFWLSLLLVTTSAQAATKMTVDQLKQALVSLQQAGKSDDEFATRLKEVELTEELTAREKNDLMQYLPGTVSIEQLSILEGRSAFLPPAPNPADPPAPDAAAQEAILDKAMGYAANTLAQLPSFSATKTTARYQDDVVNTSTSAGLTVNGPNSFAHLADSQSDAVEMDKGAEKPPAKAKASWGQNGQISPPGLPIPLKDLVHEASEGGNLKWQRWETIDGKRIAVFSFAVDKKKSHYDVTYCCFPKTDTATGVANAGGAFNPVPGEIQSVTTWRPFKKTVGYHGELSIDPDSGAILRFVAAAELKPSDYVHQEQVRVDYSAIVVDGKEYVLPVDSFILNEVVPGGDNQTIAYSVRHGLFEIAYGSYKVH
jgi:hypothetical protein